MSTTENDQHDVADALQPLLVPVERLSNLEGNPRVGDVDAVMRSYARFGQRKPIVARRRSEYGQPDAGEVIAGNHQLEAARRLGWSHIAVVWVDDDDRTAKAFALADNRTADKGYYDDEALVAMLQEVALDPDLFEASSWTLADLDTRSARFTPADDQTAELDVRFGVLVELDDEDTQRELLQTLIDEGYRCRALTT